VVGFGSGFESVVAGNGHNNANNATAIRVNRGHVILVAAHIAAAGTSDLGHPFADNLSRSWNRNASRKAGKVLEGGISPMVGNTLSRGQSNAEAAGKDHLVHGSSSSRHGGQHGLNAFAKHGCNIKAGTAALARHIFHGWVEIKHLCHNVGIDRQYRLATQVIPGVAGTLAGTLDADPSTVVGKVYGVGFHGETWHSGSPVESAVAGMGVYSAQQYPPVNTLGNFFFR
jgi:hypothetical protein